MLKMKYLLSFLAIAALAVAQPMGPGPGGFGPGGGMFAGDGPGAGAHLTALKDYLALTDDQVTQLKELRKTNFETNVKPIVEQLRTKGKELHDLLQTSNPDPAKVGQLTVEIKALRDQIKAQRADLDKKAAAILTPAQVAKLADLEKAATLLPAMHQAMAVGLIDPPEGMGGGMGMGMRGNMGGRAGMRKGR